MSTADGASVNTPASSLFPTPYVAPTEKYFPMENDFSDHAKPTLTPGCASLYQTVVRLCDRKTGYCPFDALQIANAAGLGHSSARAHLKTLEERGFIAKIKHAVYKGTDSQGREHYRGGDVHYLVLGKQSWILVPKPPRKPRGKPRPAVPEGVLEARSLAEIKQQAAQRKHERAKNKQAKQNWSFKTHSQDKQHPAREKSQPESQPAPVVVPELRLDDKQPSEHKPLDEALLPQVLAVGVKPPVARALLADHAPELIRAQLEMLPERDAKNPAAVLVKSIREDWTPPAPVLARQKAQETAHRATQQQTAQREALAASERQKTQNRAQEAAQREEAEALAAHLDAEWEAMAEPERAPIQRALDAHFKARPSFLGGPGSVAAERRRLQREHKLGALSEPGRSTQQSPNCA